MLPSAKLVYTDAAFGAMHEDLDQSGVDRDSTGRAAAAPSAIPGEK